MVATFIAFTRLRRASVSSSVPGIWLPVSTIGLPRFLMATLRAAAVYAMVSVPCVIRNPSYLS